MAAYGYGETVEKNHHEVGSDAWIYLFEHNGKNYLLISADYLGDFDFDVFPHLLKFTNSEFYKAEFVLQREAPAINRDKAAGTILFEYAN